jgi:hypothetical protein
MLIGIPVAALALYCWLSVGVLYELPTAQLNTSLFQPPPPPPTPPIQGALLIETPAPARVAAAPAPTPRIVNVVVGVWIIRFLGTSANASAQKYRARAAASVTMADAAYLRMTARPYGLTKKLSGCLIPVQ